MIRKKKSTHFITRLISRAAAGFIIGAIGKPPPVIGAKERKPPNACYRCGKALGANWLVMKIDKENRKVCPTICQRKK